MYFYFDFRDAQKQRPKLMVMSVITQLLQQCVEIPSTLVSLSCAAEQQQLSLNALLAILQQLLKERSLVYMILDGLDECNSPAELMDIIWRIASWQIANAHILVTTRNNQNFKHSLEAIVHSSISFESNSVNEDIHNYVHQRLPKKQDMRQEIEAALMWQANGR